MTRRATANSTPPLHRIAVTQIRMDGSLGQTYYRHRLAEGDSTCEALRCLKRRLTRVVLAATDHQTTKTLANRQPAAAV